MSTDLDNYYDSPFNFTMENSYPEGIPLPCALQKLFNKTLECTDSELGSEKVILAWVTSVIFVIVFPTVSFVTTIRSGKASIIRIFRIKIVNFHSWSYSLARSFTSDESSVMIVHFTMQSMKRFKHGWQRRSTIESIQDGKKGSDRIQAIRGTLNICEYTRIYEYLPVVKRKRRLFNSRNGTKSFSLF